MDTGIAIDDATRGIVVHSCRTEAVQGLFHAGAPIRVDGCQGRPLLDPIRDEPQFKQIVESLNFPT